MPPKQTATPYRNTTLRELLAIAGLTLGFFVISAYFELFDWMVQFPIHHREWHIPEISGALIYSAIGLFAVAVRRWYDLDEAYSQVSRLCLELEREKSDIQVLSELADLLQSCLSSEESRRIIGELGRRAFPNHVGGIYLFRSSRNILEPEGTWDEPDTDVRRSSFSPSECWALRRGLPHLSDGLGAEPRCTHLEEAFQGWSLCVPMAAMGETIGVLHIRAGRSETGPAGQLNSPRTPRDASFAVRFAGTAATALANLQIRETLRYQSVRDPLTGLFNRRYLEDLLNVETGRAVRKLRPLSLIMLDADHFKHFNDTFGHEAGDNILQALAGVFTRVLRKEDLACRFGGEEFILVLPEAPMEIAFTRALRIAEEVRRMGLSHEGRILGPVTVSAGVASFPDHGATATALVQAADAALYQAKALGRDRVVLAAPPAPITVRSPETPLPSSEEPPPNPKLQ